LGDFGLRDAFQERIVLKTNLDRHRQAAYEIFSVERRFRRSKSRFYRFKETCARGHQRAVPPQKSLFYRCWPVFRANSWRQTDSLRTETAIGFRASREP